MKQKNSTVSHINKTMDIQTFLNTPYLAVYRPIKKTYAFIEWNAQRRFWKPKSLSQDEIPNIDIRSHSTPEGKVNINISPFTNYQKYVRCKAINKYMHYNNTRVPIIQKLPGSQFEFKQSMFNGEFPCTTINALAPVYAEPMWSLYPTTTVQVAPVVVAPVPVAPVVAPIQPTPIPKRIAWLIAEDACKNNEICSITLEELTPITASVTSCFHVFDKTALAQWFLTKEVCPMCKTRTVATMAFDE